MAEEIKKEAPKPKVVKEVPKVTNLHAVPLITFDAYFEILKRENPKIKDHHKRPILAFVNIYSSFTNTKEEFDKIIARY